MDSCIPCTRQLVLWYPCISHHVLLFQLSPPSLPPCQYLYSLMAMTSSDVDTSRQGQHAERLCHVEMALESLYNVIHNNAGVEAQCIGHFKLLFSLLRIQGASKLQMLALQVWM